jgi:hypothetical protein
MALIDVHPNGPRRRHAQIKWRGRLRVAVGYKLR